MDAQILKSRNSITKETNRVVLLINNDKRLQVPENISKLFVMYFVDLVELGDLAEIVLYCLSFFEWSFTTPNFYAIVECFYLSLRGLTLF